MESFNKRMKRQLLGYPGSWRFNPQAPSALPAMSSDDVNGCKISVSLGESLSQDQRGAVWPFYPAEAFSGEGVDARPYPVDHEAIRTMLIFFDRFDVPRPTVVQMDGLGWGSEQFAEVGILNQSGITLDGAIDVGIRNAVFETYLARERHQPGQWALSRPAQGLGIPDNAMGALRAFTMTLQNALPVFTRDVDLQDVLEFKHRRQAELVSLRQHMDKIINHVSCNGISNLVASETLQEFQGSLESYVRTMQESNHAKVWRSIRANTDWPALVGAGAEASITHAFPTGSLAAAGATIGFRVIKGLRKRAASVNPFEYLTSAHRDL